MERPGMADVVVSFEAPGGFNIIHNHVELTVFNCPMLNIYAPQVIVYIDDALRIVRPDDPLGIGMPTANGILSVTSCDYLYNFCLAFTRGINIPFFNFVFPYQNNSDFVFLGEVTFLNNPGNPPCGQPELIPMPILTPQG